MKKSDLKNGKVVTLRHGEECLIVNDMLIKNNFRFNMFLKEYNEDLTHKKSKNRDIVKVQEFNKEFVLWEREEIDWSKVSIGTKVLVSDNKRNWYEHCFIKYNLEEDKYKFKCMDAKSKQIHTWKYCKLAEEVTKEELKKEYLDFMEPEVHGYECDEEEIECLAEWILDYYNVKRK